MKKKSFLFAIITVTSTLLTGCSFFSSNIPELSETEEAMVVEYATEVLLHYDRMNGDKIRPVKYDIITEEGESVSDEQYADQLMNEAMDSSGLSLPQNDIPADGTDNGVSVIDNTVPEDTGASIYASIADCFGLSGISINPIGYEITDFYPESPTEYFVMNATEGNRLVILRFELSNDSGSDMHVEIPYGDVKYKITLNDTTKNALTTLLINDMGTFSEDVASTDKKEVVLVGEFPIEDANNISALSVLIKRENGSINVNFK